MNGTVLIVNVRQGGPWAFVIASRMHLMVNLFISKFHIVTLEVSIIVIVIILSEVLSH